MGEAVDVASRRRRLAAASSIIIPYTITIPSVTEAGFPDAQTAFTAINTNLNTAASTGALAATILTISTTENIPITVSLNVTFSNVTADSLIVEEDTNHRRYVSKGEIAGIVIGSIVGVALLAVIIYYTLRMRRSSLGETSSVAGDKGEVYRDLGADSLPAIENGEASSSSAPAETSLVAASENDTRV